MRRKYIPLSIPNFGKEEEKNVLEAVHSEQVSTNGAFVREFEERLREYTNSGYAVACQSGTAGLHLSLLTLGITEGMEVIVPTLTFIAAANSVRYVGATPVFMDCDDFFNIDVEKTEKFCRDECMFDGERLLNKKTGNVVKAILPVHIFGNLADMDRIMELAKRYRLNVVEDATEAIGCYFLHGKYANKFSGTIGDVGVYSFNVNKIITSGGGGALITSNGQLAERGKFYSTQAKEDALHFIHGDVGFNYRMGNMQAAIAIAQLGKLERFIEIKKKNYMLYQEKGVDLMPFQKNIRSNYWFYSCRTGQRDALIDALRDNHIQARPIWTLCHQQKPYLRNPSYYIEKAIEFQRTIVNIPSSTGMSEEDIGAVSEIVRRYQAT